MSTLQRHTPLKAKRAKPRTYKTPRCSRQRCEKAARINGWCESHAEREADRLFSLYIRRRDQGCTGAAVFPEMPCWGDLQAAHIEPRGNHSTRFDPDDVWTLCEAHHSKVDRGSRHAAKARWAVHVLGIERYHELIERAALTTPRTVAIQQALSWLEAA